MACGDTPASPWPDSRGMVRHLRTDGRRSVGQRGAWKREAKLGRCWPLRLAGLHPLPSALSSRRGPPLPGALFRAGGRDTSLRSDRLGGMSVPPGSFCPPRPWWSMSIGWASGLAAAPARSTVRPAPKEPVAGGLLAMVAQSLTLGCQPRPWRPSSSGRARSPVAVPVRPIVCLIAAVGPTMRSTLKMPAAVGSSAMVGQSADPGCPAVWRGNSGKRRREVSRASAEVTAQLVYSIIRSIPQISSKMIEHTLQLSRGSLHAIARSLHSRTL